MEYNGVLTIKEEPTTNTPVDYTMDWVTGLSGLPHVVVGKSLRYLAF